MRTYAIAFGNQGINQYPLTKEVSIQSQIYHTHKYASAI